MGTMTYKAFILIPGARWPEPAARHLLETLTSAERAMLDAFGDAAEDPVTQWIAPEPFGRAPHLVWAWRVVAQRRGAPVTAPYAWVAQGGPEQSTEMWALTPITRDAEGRVGGVFPITDDLTLPLLMRLSPAVEAAGGRLQWSGAGLYLTTKTLWDASAAPAGSLEGLPWDELAHQRAGTDAHKLEELSLALTDAAKADPKLTGIAGFWLHGGGTAEGALPPTKIRAVLSDDAAIRGWAQKAGMLKDRTTPFATAWRAAPKGDLLAVIPHLMRPWLRGDLDAWRRALPEAHAAFMALKAEAASDAREADEPVVVMFGAGTSATMTPKEAGLLSFIRRPKPVAPLLWLIDGVSP